METTRTTRPNLRRLLQQMDTSTRASIDFTEAAGMLQMRFGNADMMGEEIQRLNNLAVEYQQDAEDIMETICEHFTPEQVEAAMA